MNFSVVLFIDTEPKITGAQRSIYGFPLLERHFRVFASLGASQVTVIDPSDIGERETIFKRFEDIWFQELKKVNWLRVNDPTDSWLTGNDECILLLDGHHLYDERVLKAMINNGPNKKVIDTSSINPCRLLFADLNLLQNLTVNWSDSESLWSAVEGLSERSCSVFDLSIMNPYIVDLRRNISAWWVILDSDKKILTAEMFLIDAAQKGTLDFPAEFIHPPLENRVTKWISKKAVTPNQITTVTVLLAFLGTGLMALGFLASGLMLAFLVGILDGVDGKLARTTVRCTRFGDKYEHILDVVYELTWYWAIGWMLSQNGTLTGPFIFSGTITIFYLLDKMATGIFKSRRGIELFDYAPIDRFFRRIGARRNINFLLLLGGLVIGMTEELFIFVAIWTFFTAIFHWKRSLWLLYKSRLNGKLEMPI